MSLPVNTIRTIYIEHLQAIYARCPAKLMQSVREAVETEADNIADTFYSVISSVTGSDNFLVDDLVETRLKKAMASWIRGLYRHRDTQELAEYIDSQLKIGSVHARINVPAHLLNTGIRVVKLEIHKIS